MRKGLEPTQSQERWLSVEACPACGDNAQLHFEMLDVEEYRFGNEIIPTPTRGIRLAHCRRCRLIFKDVLPSPRLLEQVFTRQAGQVWADSYDFADEVEVVCGLTDGGSFDVLDIGASNGGLLKALTFIGSGGRRSALDVVMHPGLDVWLRGEFIRGLVDSGDLMWSGEPYDVVTMFDVAEHLYDPNQAFFNLRRLVKPGGFVVIETGDSSSLWPRKFGAGHWWYARLFEHHVFWSRQSLEFIADKYGFRIAAVLNKRHKGEHLISTRRHLVNAVNTMLYLLMPKRYGRFAKVVGETGTQTWVPNSYSKFAKVVGETGTQTWHPFTRDHVRVILQKTVERK